MIKSNDVIGLEKSESIFFTDKSELLRINLQFFADSADGGAGDGAEHEGEGGTDAGSDGGQDDETPASLEELFEKFPHLKEQHEKDKKAAVRKAVQKRFKEGSESKKQDNPSKKEETGENDELSTLKAQIDQQNQLIQQAQEKANRAEIKEYAMGNGFDPELSAALIPASKVELDENGDPANLEELFGEVANKFPQYFGAQDEEGAEKAATPAKRTTSYIPGSTNKKSNPTPKVDRWELGKQRALARHKREDK